MPVKTASCLFCLFLLTALPAISQELPWNSLSADQQEVLEPHRQNWEKIPEERRRLLDGILEQLDDLPPTAHMPVLLTTMNVRARLRREIKDKFPYLAVLSYRELSPDMNIQPIARISWS